jgi:hypothetical protein
MANGRCRMHGGPSTGPRTPEGIEAIRRSRTKHGGRSQAAIQGRREFREAMRQLRELIKRAESDPDDVIDALARMNGAYRG